MNHIKIAKGLGVHNPCAPECPCRSGEMANTEDWTIAPRRSGDKTIEFFGPGTLHLSLDFDDVDHKEVERALPQILSKLNSEPPIDIE